MIEDTINLETYVAPLSSILSRYCTISVVLKYLDDDHYRLLAYRLLREIGDYQIDLKPHHSPGTIESYGDAFHIKNFHELDEWQERVQYAFDESRAGVIISVYVVDHDMSSAGGEFGTIETDQEGRRYVLFTFGGPTREWLRYPLSDYRLTQQ